MPLVLPDPDDATRVISSPQTQVAAPSVVPDETSEGATAVGRAITKLGDDITAFQAKRQIRLDESAYSQAVADFELANIQTVDSFTEDRDFANYDTNYTKQIIPKRDEFAKQITNPLFQQRFKNETDISISRARATLHGQGYKIEVQEGRAAFAKNSETYKNLYAIAKDEDARTAATEKYMADFESPNNKEYFNAEERQVLLEAWNEEANVARFNFLPLEEQVAAFKNNEPWLQDIDPGVRAKLKKVAEKAYEADQEDALTEYWVSKLIDDHEGTDNAFEGAFKASSKAPASIRGDVQSRITTMAVANNRIKNERQDAQKAEYVEKIFHSKEVGPNGKPMTPEQVFYSIKPSEWGELGDESFHRLMKKLVEKGPSTTPSEADANQIDIEANPLLIKEYDEAKIKDQLPKEFHSEAGRLLGEYRKNQQIPEVAAAEATQIFTETLAPLVAVANSAGLVTRERALKRVSVAKARWRAKRDAYRASHEGRFPTAVEAKNISNRIVEEFTVDRGWTGTDTDFIRAEIPLEELEDIITTYKTETGVELTIQDAEDRWLDLHNARPAE